MSNSVTLVRVIKPTNFTTAALGFKFELAGVYEAEEIGFWALQPMRRHDCGLVECVGESTLRGTGPYGPGIEESLCDDGAAGSGGH